MNFKFRKSLMFLRVSTRTGKVFQHEPWKHLEGIVHKEEIASPKTIKRKY